MFKYVGGLILCALSLLSHADEQPYQLGRGLQVNPSMTVGGYFSTEYSVSDNAESFALDDLAVLVYGDIGPDVSYLAELESAGFYQYDFDNKVESWNESPSVERLYVDYHFSDFLSVRLGKQIMPIGYWNLQPINVLRDTTSNPKYSTDMFPKFLTGVDLYGYAAFDEDLSWHFFAQASEDIDDSYINIAADRQLGLSIEKTLNEQWKLGGSIGQFRQINGAKSKYFQLNGRYTQGDFSASLEGIVKDNSGENIAKTTTSAVFVQAEYAMTMRHKVVGRFERYEGPQNNGFDFIKTVGYSYRPVYPVSIKAEFQWFSDPGDNRFLASFAVLF